ncbi:Salicylate carboxymethyltransferase [Linum perenne]
MNALNMNGGTGDTSYAMNSFLQQKVIAMSKPITEEAITRLITSSSSSPMKTLAIADLRCASGPNTLLAISNLIKTIITISSNLNWEICPEFQVFLNDLPGNDFNSIFTSLEQFRSQLKEETAPCGELPSMFFNGVPGSFYGRLFPVESLHFEHSSYSLHWLSQVPEGVEEANKGRISVSSGSDPSVVEAYRGQFEGDFVSGGGGDYPIRIVHTNGRVEAVLCFRPLPPPSSSSAPAKSTEKVVSAGQRLSLAAQI